MPAQHQGSVWRVVVARFDDVTPENVFNVAGAIQDALGCVPREAVVELSTRSGLPLARLWGALTAYPGFKVEVD